MLKILKELISQFRALVRLVELLLKNIFSKDSALGEVNVAISVTSHGKRIPHIWSTLESIANGNSKPKKIIVWLDESLDESKLTNKLLRLKNRGVVFKYVPDIGPHQKYFYSLKYCIEENTPLVTIDDDCIYPKWWLKKLIDSASESPSTIVAYRGRLIQFSEKGDLLSYNDWPFANTTKSIPNFFFTGVSGVYYPVGFLKILLQSDKEFITKCPKADDVWLNYIATTSNYPARQIDYSPWGFPTTPFTQSIALWKNNSSGGNDKQILKTYDINTIKKIYNLTLTNKFNII